MTYQVTFAAGTDGRERMFITNTERAPHPEYNPTRWSRVRNIDGSAPWMRDDGWSWTFLPHGNRELMKAVEAALRARECVGA